MDGYPRAYHPDNYAGGGIDSLCNAGTAYIPGQAPITGANDCTRFLAEYAKIRVAGWRDPSVGAIRWYGLAAQDSVVIDGVSVRDVVPLLQANGVGFFTSTTALFDATVVNRAEQSRYLDASKVAYGAAPKVVTANGFGLGTLGVVFNSKKNIAVPFVVGDVSPRLGEGSAALARRASGLSTGVTLTRGNRYEGDVSSNDVLWVFFGGTPVTYTSSAPEQIESAAATAFAGWGGEERLKKCAATVPR